MLLKKKCFKVYASLFCVLLIVCCSRYDEMPNLILPDRVDSFSKNFIILVHSGNHDDIRELVVDNYKGDENILNINNIVAKLHDGSIEEMSIVGIRFFEYNDYTEYMAKYLIKYKKGYQIAHIDLLDQKGQLLISKFNLEEFNPNIKVSNNNTTPSISNRRYLFSMLTLLYYLLIAISIISCAKSRVSIRKKMLLVFVILIGIIKITFNWNTGDWNWELINIGIAIQVYSPNEGSFLHLSFYLPVGAIVFFINRKNWLNQNLPKDET